MMRLRGQPRKVKDTSTGLNTEEEFVFENTASLATVSLLFDDNNNTWSLVTGQLVNQNILQ